MARCTLRDVPTPPRTPRSLLVLVALAASLLVAGCMPDEPSGSPASSDPAAGSPSASAAAASESPSPVPAASESPSVAPTESAEASEAPTPDPTETHAAVSPAPASSCSGTPDNIDFFAGAAASLPWTVYCAVLPDGWAVQAGSYRLADGGNLKIAYVARSGARFEIREGTICRSDPACIPAGESRGEIAFADRTGELLAIADGGWALVSDPEGPVVYVAYGYEMDEAALRALAAAVLPLAP